jgi:hypothetical protein
MFLVKSIHEATASYLVWLKRHLELIPADLKRKAELMREGPFPFLRATFYRWSQVFPQVCPDLMKAPEVLGVGDLHIENFGTWRDSEGRLIWGVNDFDEACYLPYPVDLVRLATSALLAVDAGTPFRVPANRVCMMILKGYIAALKAGGRPFVLSERYPELREMATHRLKNPGPFWQKLDTLMALREPIPGGARKWLLRSLPEKKLDVRVVHRVSGLGSLGRRRFAAITEWNGGRVAREAKELAPSAWVFAQKRKGGNEILYGQILKRAQRCPDPFLTAKGRWVVRRLAPDSSRIELASLPDEHDAEVLLESMGWETANIHLGCVKAKVILADLKKRKPGWLDAAAKAMHDATLKDWKAWRR